MAVDNDGCSFRGTQGDMEHRPIFGGVDFVAPKHSVDVLPQPGFLGELKKSLNSLICDAVFRIIQVNTDRFGCHSRATLWIISEQAPQMQFANLFKMQLEVLPCRSLSERKICERFYYCVHI